MTDLATVEAPAVSTTLEPDTAPNVSGGGAVTPEPEPKPEPKSLRDTIADVVKKTDGEARKDAEAEPDAKGDEAKGEKEPKEGPEKPEPKARETLKAPERGPDGKFAAKEAEETDAKPAEAKHPEAKPNGHVEPPKTFLPDAKETWRNTPKAVQRDVADMAQRHEAELTKYREGAERYETIRQYDEMARQNGRAGVHESLAEVAQLEDMMQKNPLAALNRILMQAGPRKADGQPISLYELATAIVNSGQDGYQRMVSQESQPQQRQPDPEVAQLKAQLAQIQEQQLAATIIEPFRAANPRYDELEGDIAFFLQSGKIPASLSPSDRLAAAYDMAVRINPASHDNDAAPETDLEPARRADESFSAGKSIKSAPGAITPTMEPQRGRSIGETLRANMKRQAVS